MPERRKISVFQALRVVNSDSFFCGSTTFLRDFDYSKCYSTTFLRDFDYSKCYSTTFLRDFDYSKCYSTTFLRDFDYVTLDSSYKSLQTPNHNQWPNTDCVLKVP